MLLVPPRADDPEIMDRPGHDPATLCCAHRDLRLVNRFLGGRRALLDELRPFLLERTAGGALSVLDVGTGGGDLPLDVAALAERLRRAVRVIAIDRDPTAAALAAHAAHARPEIAVLVADARALPFAPRSFDLVVASLFLHHFVQREVTELLARFGRLARRAVVINDLRRHRLPWLVILLLARASRRHPIFVHDAPLSVLRGFTAAELREAASAAGFPRARLRHSWPFRLVLTLPCGAAG